MEAYNLLPKLVILKRNLQYFVWIKDFLNGLNTLDMEIFDICY